MNKRFKQLNLTAAKDAFDILAAFDYTIQQFSEYHFRINGRLDIWPSSRKWFDCRAGVKGTYRDLVTFVRDHFESLAPDIHTSA